MATAMKYRGFAGAVVDASVQARRFASCGFRSSVAELRRRRPSIITVSQASTCRSPAPGPGESWRHRDGGRRRRRGGALARAADVLRKSQELDDTDDRMLPFIEKFRSINEAVKQFGRI